MPGLDENPYFRINSIDELCADMHKCFTIYDVSLYLSNKLESCWKENELKKKLSVPEKSVLNTYVKQKITTSNSEIKCLRNLNKVRENIRSF